MDSIERMRLYAGDRNSPPIHQPAGAIPPDMNTKGITRNFGHVQGHSPLSGQGSPNHIHGSPSRSPGLGLPPPPGLTHGLPPQYGNYPVFDNSSGHTTGGIYSPTAVYFQPPLQPPQYQNGFGQAQFGVVGTGDGMYSFKHMGSLQQQPQEQMNSRFPPYTGRKMSMEGVLPANMNEENCLPFLEPVTIPQSSMAAVSTAGTYTHFGPMNPLLSSLGVRNINNNESSNDKHHQELEFEMLKQLQQPFELNLNQDLLGKGDGLPSSGNFNSGVMNRSTGGGGEPFVSQVVNQPPSPSVIGSGKFSPVNVGAGASQVPRSLTPNGIASSYSACLKEQQSQQRGNSGGDTSSAKSQVSGKPSYLEILTKNTATSVASSTFRRGSSSSSEQIQASNATSGDCDAGGTKRDSPTLTSGSGSTGHIQPLLQLHLHGGTHRKSSDGFGLLNSSPGTSNSSTASSSPITKPKTQQKGKENYLSGFIKTSTKSSSTVTGNGTPSKQNHLNEKKSQGQNGGNGKKITGKNYKNSKFEFEIDDLDDEEDVGDEDGTSGQDPEVEVEEKSSKRKGKDRKNGATPANGNGSLSSKSGVEKFSNGLGLQLGRKGREKTEKPRSRKEERNCLVRRFRLASKLWLGHLISALTWFWSLVANVTSLSAAVGFGLSEDLCVWWTVRALPWLRLKARLLKTQAKSLWQKFKWKEWMTFRKKEPQRKTEEIEDLSDLLAMLGPERNIVLPANGDEALRRLQSVKGQDPYSILGVRSNSPDETIRRYYKKQAVLVHPDKNLVPGAEEAFKILARAFELVGEPARRMEYHKQLLEAHAKERFMGEFGNLFEQLRKKLESACTTIRCTKCNARHKKNRTNRPLFAARYCAQCRIHHGAREGELWAEKSGILGFWTYYAAMGNHVWEINEWGKCQSESLKHLNANSHNVLYRLVSGGQGQRQSRHSQSGNPSSPSEEDLLDPEMDDWDSLINNLYRGAGSGSASGSSMPSAGHHKSGSSTNAHHTNANVPNASMPNGSASTSTGRKRKGKRK